MLTTVHCDLNAEEIKSKSILGVFDQLKLAVGSKRLMLKIDATPPQVPSNENIPIKLNIPQRNIEIHYELDKKHIKSKSVRSLFNQIELAVTPKQPMLESNADSRNDTQISSSENPSSTQLPISDQNARMVQTGVKQSNQNATVIGAPANMSINQNHYSNVHSIGLVSSSGSGRKRRNKKIKKRPRTMSETDSGKWIVDIFLR